MAHLLTTRKTGSGIAYGNRALLPRAWRSSQSCLLACFAENLSQRYFTKNAECRHEVGTGLDGSPPSTSFLRKKKQKNCGLTSRPRKDG